MTTENTPFDSSELSTPSPKPNTTLRIFQIIGWAVEALAGLFTLLGLFFKLQSWEGGAEMLIIGMSTLAFFYPFMLWAVVGSRTWLQGLLTVPVGLALFLGLASALFRWESWQGAYEMALVGIMTLLAAGFVSLILTLIRYSKSDNKPFYWHIMVRLVVAILLTAPGIFKAF
jgi:hypothetical protein